MNRIIGFRFNRKAAFNSGVLIKEEKASSAPPTRQGKADGPSPFPLSRTPFLIRDKAMLTTRSHETDRIDCRDLHPFREDGSVNLDLIPAMIDYMIKSGVSGFTFAEAPARASP